MEEYREERCIVPLMAALPKAGDRVDPLAWREAAGFDGLNNGPGVDLRAARVFVGATRSHLCLAVLSEMAPAGTLRGDAIEVQLNDGHLIRVTPQGRLSHHLLRPGQSPLRQSLRAGGVAVKAASALHDNLWHCRIFIPASLFGRPDTTSSPWALNVTRLFHQPAARASLARQPDRPLVFQFTPDPVVAVQCRHADNPFHGNIRLWFSLFNPAAVPAEVRVELLCRLPRRPDLHGAVSVRLEPGEQREVMVKNEALAALSFDMTTVATQDGNKPLLTRCLTYARSSAPHWTPPAPPPLPVDFQFAYYPSRNLLRLRADVSGLPRKARLTLLNVEIRPKGGGPAVHSFTLKRRQFVRGVCETDVTLPPLEGEFEIAATGQGEQVPAEPRVKTFERRRFEWENKGLGTSRTVYPPFTPIEKEGNIFRTVLKEYALNDSGLFDRIRTGHSERPEETEDLLAAPMRYAAAIDGVAHAAIPSALAFESVAADRVVARSRFTLGPLAAEAALTLDYDGTLRVDLTLPAAPGTRLDKLDLEIPLRNGVARQVHACSGRYRDAVEFKTLPEGQGVVWSAADIPPTGWEANFCSYLFLGNANRGLCWFAENSRGWSRVPGSPNLEVTRQGDELLLRVHLVNRPVPLDEARTLTFGLLAAPVKPRLAGWRHRWYSDRFSVLGCDCHWLSLGNYACYYPPGKALSLWEALRRGNRERLDQAAIDAVIRDHRRHFAPYGESAVRLFENMANLNLRNRHGARMIYYYNRDVTVDSEECRTFVDEWGTEDYNEQRDRQALPHPPSRKAMGVVPSASHLDFILHWYGRSFDAGGNTGIYMDNLYFRPFRNRAMSAAFRDEQGAMVPSTGIWELREQAKRTFTFLNERGMEPIHMGHMTSLALLPILSFYTVQYDWEWQRGHKDVHDRFTRDYLQLVSSGELAGAWPIVLHELGEQEEGMVEHYPYPELRRRLDEAAARAENPRVLRTFLGVTIVHELLVDPYRWHYEPVGPGDTAENRLFKMFRQPILDFVQRPGVEVYRYWDKRPQPMRTADPELPAIVFVDPGKETLCAITNYAAEERTAELVIDLAALGFPAGCLITDTETGKTMPLTGNKLAITLKGHDLCLLRVQPA